jgi:hypothetical protein
MQNHRQNYCLIYSNSINQCIVILKYAHTLLVFLTWRVAADHEESLAPSTRSALLLYNGRSWRSIHGAVPCVELG